MGRVHKKKIAQYQKDSETAETDEQSVKDKDESRENDDENNSDVDVPSNTSANSGGDTKKNSSGNDVDQFSEHEDDSDVDGESDAEEEKPLVSKNGKKTATKRKQTSKKSKNDGNIDSDADEEPIIQKNGESSVKRVKPSKQSKRGKKTKTAAPAAPSKNEESHSENEEMEGEEEYEVKDVVGHKVERGVNYYLIRWKGYTKDDDTWESEDTLSCQDLIDKYMKKQKNSISSNEKKVIKKKLKPSGDEKKRKGRPALEDPEKEWEVDKIIDFAEEKEGRVFRIRWKGFGSKFDTWEPEENLSCGDLIQKFMKKMESQKDVTFKHLRKTPKKTKRLVNETAVLPKENSARKSKRAAGKKRITYADSDE